MSRAKHLELADQLIELQDLVGRRVAVAVGFSRVGNAHVWATVKAVGTACGHAQLLVAVTPPCGWGTCWVRNWKVVEPLDPCEEGSDPPP